MQQRGDVGMYAPWVSNKTPAQLDRVPKLSGTGDRTDAQKNVQVAMG